jgi:hypothetical protein
VAHTDTDVAAKAELTEAERATLAAAVDTLVPDDGLGPSGTGAGVDTYIQGMLVGRDPIFEMYRANLAALDVAAGEGGFAGLDLSARTSLLQQAEADQLEGFVPNSAMFFGLLHHNMLEGLFGDPQHGGNIGMAGWALQGYKGVKLVQTAEDQRIGPTPDRPLTSRVEALADVR